MITFHPHRSPSASTKRSGTEAGRCSSSRVSWRTSVRRSEKRANMVKDYAVSQGVPASTITVVGKGESEPTDDNSTKEGRANNRRVVIRATR